MTVRDGLSHPLVGREQRFSVVAWGYLLLTVILVVLTDVLLWLFRGTRRFDWLLDGVVGLAILAVALSVVFAIIYGVFAGGPVTAGVLALGPVTAGSVLSGTLVLDIDITVALSAGAVGGTAGTIRAGRSFDELRPDCLAVATVLTAASAFATVRMVSVHGPHVRTVTALVTVFSAVAVAILGVLWVVALIRAPE